MSVLSCNRNRCKNIMCNRHSHQYGYICDECFEQLVRSDLSITEFMKTNKIVYCERPDRRSELDTEFPLNDKRYYG
jgi:hypothetical protein